MDNEKFIKRAKQLVKGCYNSHTNKPIPDDEIFVVWSCKTLQNNKALLATRMMDGMYYEVTYNGDKGEFYLDVYKKQENICYKE